MLYVLIWIWGGVTGICIMWVVLVHTTKVKETQTKVLQKQVDMLNQWLILKHAGVFLGTELEKRNIHVIAIYGMGIFGRHLVRELEKTNVKVHYGIDMKVKDRYRDIPVYRLDNNNSVDAVINTVSYDEQNIMRKLKQYYTCPILNLSELVYASYPEKIAGAKNK